MDILLNNLRAKRNFDGEKWIFEKIMKLNDYMKNNNLSCCVVSVSGGIDSAVTYKLCKLAEAWEDSPIKKVVGIAQPINSTKSIWERALLLDDNIKIIDQSNVFNNLTNIVLDNLNLNKNQYADGQLKSYMRTPVNYYVAQLMSVNGFPSIVMGTGNYDEDGYLYYFCKAGDGVVDVQLISDLHKSEVYKVAKILKVPEKIIEAPPSADLWEGQTDEQELGISYDFIELYTELLKYNKEEQEEMVSILSEKEWEKFKENKEIAENIHKKNSHKINFPVNL